MLRPPLADRLRSSLAGRIGPLQPLLDLIHLAWSTSPTLKLTSLSPRIVRAGVLAGMLYVAKLVVDAVVAGRAIPASGVAMTDWLVDPSLRQIELLVGLEFALTLASDLLRRATNLVDGILGERTVNATSLRLMADAATLDLAQFEDLPFRMAWSVLAGRSLGAPTHWVSCRARRRTGSPQSHWQLVRSCSRPGSPSSWCWP